MLSYEQIRLLLDKRNASGTTLVLDRIIMRRHIVRMRYLDYAKVARTTIFVTRGSRKVSKRTWKL